MAPAAEGDIIGRVEAVCVGQPRPLGPASDPSAIFKEPVVGPILAAPLGLDGDTQANKQFHGGVHMAVHFYPSAHYPGHRQAFPDIAEQFGPGGMGENITTAGLDEAGVCIGDHLRIGSAVFEVSQGRKPCQKLNWKHGVDSLLSRVRTSGQTGWYCRVVQDGALQAGDDIVLVARPHPNWPVSRAYAAILGKSSVDASEVEQAISLPPLGPDWAGHGKRRLTALTKA